MIDTVESLKQRRNGLGARPNVYKRSREARDTTDGFLRLAAGLDTDEPRPRVAWYRRLKVWELGLLILVGVGLCVGLWLS